MHELSQVDRRTANKNKIRIAVFALQNVDSVRNEYAGAVDQQPVCHGTETFCLRSRCSPLRSRGPRS